MEYIFILSLKNGLLESIYLLIEVLVGVRLSTFWKGCADDRDAQSES